jgi:hypothetical protein
MWKMFTPMAIAVLGMLSGCGDETGGSVRPESAPTSSPESTLTTAESRPTTAGSTPSAAPAPPVSSDCDEQKVLTAIAASEAADPGGDITYLRCLDGYGWATYYLASVDESAIVLLSVAPNSYRVLNLGTSVCPLDHIPADIAVAIAPDDPYVVLDCE